MAIAAMDNSTLYENPTLPSYTLSPRPSMITGVPDIAVQLFAPIIAYWVVSLIFHALDTFDICAEYRLHTPAELLKRNHVTKYEVIRDVIVQQVIQTIVGTGFNYFEPAEMVGKESFDVAVWAQRLRRVEAHFPNALAVVGLDAVKLANKMQKQLPALASVLVGGHHTTPGFATWETTVAKFVYWVGVPFIQFIVAILIVDTWQYFMHRAMHMNKWLYTTLHSRHHRLYVPYAFGALYNHPIEGLFMDTLGAGIAYMATGMTIRQGMWFFTCCTIKTVDDHCGYAFPWDPLQHFTSNNAAYHDVHHQSWGVKTNFSQPFFTFWDRFLGTAWTGGDVSSRYTRDRLLAQKKVDADQAAMQSSVVNSPATNIPKAERQAKESQQQILDGSIDDGATILNEESREEQEVAQITQRGARRKLSGFDTKSLSDKVSENLYGRSTPILHASTLH